VQRKDNGFIQTRALLTSLPKAQGLTTLDVQRLCIDDPTELASVLERLEDSLEEVRFTSIVSKVSLDPVVEMATSMIHLKSLSISTDAAPPPNGSFISHRRLSELLTQSTTLQDLTLRQMHLDNAACTTLASALQTNTFLTSLDIRQNPGISADGYNAILKALELNHDLWCSVLVSDESFQGKFNALIELNQVRVDI
jgi:hypothetical protein